MESALRQGGDRPGLKLIETMHWDGMTLARRGLHMDRLHRGAAAFGWPVPDAAIDRALADLPADPARVRLTLDGAGGVEVQVGALPKATSPWRLGLAAVRLRSDDPWLGVKSTERAVYDAARATLPVGLDEVIFANERGEVCDGTITTVFFDRGEGLRTPPLSSGLLPGVLRAAMLAQGEAREEVLHAWELASVRLFVGNALRGLIAAVWAGG